MLSELLPSVMELPKVNPQMTLPAKKVKQGDFPSPCTLSLRKVKCVHCGFA